MLKRIDHLCRFAFHFLNMNAVFIDDVSNNKSEYVFTKIPDSLKPYFSSIIHKLHLNEASNDCDILFHSSPYRLNYISARIYEDTTYLGSIVIGPYLLEEPTILMVQSVITENKMTISLKDIVKQYYLSLPMVSTYTAKVIAEFLSYMMSAFHSKDIENPLIGSLTYDFKTEYATPMDIIKQNTEEYTKSLQERYRFENDMLNAIERGDRELFERVKRKRNLFVSYTPDRFLYDPLRSGKNYNIVLNTLFRKAAERGGLHPIYLDSISSKYAVQIEKCTTIKQLMSLRDSMEMEYCEAVKKFSLQNYSPYVRKIIEYIQINLNQILSLGAISKALSLSPYEISRRFKSETGEAISNHINKIRINEAAYILENENITITDASYMVGFNDVNYFTKVFKKLKGVTPSEYRSNKKKEIK